MKKMKKNEKNMTQQFNIKKKRFFVFCLVYF